MWQGSCCYHICAESVLVCLLLPLAGGVPVSCPVAITNNGNVALSSLSLVGAPAGYSLTCADTTALIPAAVRTCTLDRTVNQVR